MNRVPLYRPAHAAWLGLVTALFFSACNTPTSPAPATATPTTSQAKRIAEHQKDYDALPATTQKQLTDGLISQGQNLKLVYLALGHPDRIIITPDGKNITWTYRNYTPPVLSTNRVVVGRETKQNFGNTTPLQDTFDAWNHGLVKHEVPDSPEGRDMSQWTPKIIPKAPTQSWAEYGKYRLELKMIQGNAARPTGDVLTAMKNANKKAEEAYQEALTIPPIASPDPIKLDVIFVDQQVSDAIVDDSFSAFSFGPLPLPMTAAPGVQGNMAE